MTWNKKNIFSTAFLTVEAHFQNWEHYAVYFSRSPVSKKSFCKTSKSEGRRNTSLWVSTNVWVKLTVHIWLESKHSGSLCCYITWVKLFTFDFFAGDEDKNKPKAITVDCLHDKDGNKKPKIDIRAEEFYVHIDNTRDVQVCSLIFDIFHNFKLLVFAFLRFVQRLGVAMVLVYVICSPNTYEILCGCCLE